MTRIAASLAAALLLLAGASAHAQTYPSKPIKFLVPFAAGGPADTMARLTAQVLSEGIGQSIVIDNRPGAGGIIGARAAAAADPDGYTLMYGNTASLVVGPAVYANPGYDPVKNFAPIALVAVSYNVLVLNPTFPANSVPELIAYAKKNPGKVNFASPGHALRAADRAYLLRGGERIAEGKVAEVLTKVQLEELYRAPVDTLTDTTSGSNAFLPG